MQGSGSEGPGGPEAPGGLGGPEGLKVLEIMKIMGVLAVLGVQGRILGDWGARPHRKEFIGTPPRITQIHSHLLKSSRMAF